MTQTAWLENHKLHCLQLNLNYEYVKNNIAKAEIEVERFHISEKERVNDLHNSILENIVSRLNLKLSGKNNVGLLCSGGEDSIYLLIALVINLKKRPKLFCYQSKNNASDVKRLKKIANKFKLELNLYNNSTLDLRSSYEKFIEEQGRAPNDLAQPVHNALYFEAVEKYNCDIVVDGQFCDTVLLSNPQNHVLLWLEKYPILIKLVGKILKFLPLNKNKKLYSRIRKVNDLIDCNSMAERILKFINVEYPDQKIVELVEALVKRYGNQLAFSICFYYCLLEKRERDKYLQCPDLFSPFDDFYFAIISNENLGKVLGLFERKKPIRRICREKFPQLFRFQNTLPFELE